jgi:glucose-1-phosphate adenylyltransferase
LLNQSISNSEVATIILAGGEGRRLQPLTQMRCKPAVNFAGRYRIIDIAISNAINARYKDIFILSQFLADSLNNYLINTYGDLKLLGANLKILSPKKTEEQNIWYQGTADAVRKNLKTLLKHPAEYFIILSGDQLYNMNLNEFLQFAKEKDADLTIATIPINQNEAKRMGVMKIHPSFEITDFFEKPQDPQTLLKFALAPEIAAKHNALSDLSFLGSMGIYIFKRKALIDLLYQDNRDDFGKHLIPTQLKKGKTFAYIFDGYWEDIGTIQSYYNANLKLTTNSCCLDFYNENRPIYSQSTSLPSARIEGENVSQAIICDGSIIQASEVTHSMVGMKTFIGKGTKLNDSVIIGWSPQSEHSPTRIGENCLIQGAILDEGCQIESGVHLVNSEKIQEFDSDMIAIRDGIIIVKAGAHIPTNYRLSISQ